MTLQLWRRVLSIAFQDVWDIRYHIVGLFVALIFAFGISTLGYILAKAAWDWMVARSERSGIPIEHQLVQIALLALAIYYSCSLLRKWYLSIRKRIEEENMK